MCSAAIRRRLIICIFRDDFEAAVMELTYVTSYVETNVETMTSYVETKPKGSFSYNPINMRYCPASVLISI